MILIGLWASLGEITLARIGREALVWPPEWIRPSSIIHSPTQKTVRSALLSPWPSWQCCLWQVREITRAGSTAEVGDLCWLSRSHAGRWRQMSLVPAEYGSVVQLVAKPLREDAAFGWTICRVLFKTLHLAICSTNDHKVHRVIASARAKPNSPVLLWLRRGT